MEITNGQKFSTSKHHEQSMPSMLTNDEQHAQKIATYIRENMLDSFSVDCHTELLMKIGPGLAATSEISSALISAFDKGNNMLNAFISSRFGDKDEKSNINQYQSQGSKPSRTCERRQF